MKPLEFVASALKHTIPGDMNHYLKVAGTDESEMGAERCSVRG